MSMAAQARPVSHHFAFCVTCKILVLRISQCVEIRRTVMTETLIISKVDSKAAPFFTKPNIEARMRQAVSKSAALKNTQVTFTRKNVKRAAKKRWTDFLLRKAGAKEAL